MQKNRLFSCDVAGKVTLVIGADTTIHPALTKSRLLKDNSYNTRYLVFSYVSGSFPRHVDERKFFMRLIEHAIIYPDTTEQGVPTIVVAAMLGQCIHKPDGPTVITNQTAISVVAIVNAFMTSIMSDIMVGQRLVEGGVGVEVGDGYVIFQETF